MVNLVIYIVLGIVLFYAIRMEYTDLYCKSTTSKKCGTCMGNAYIKGKPVNNDDINTLLNKIAISARYELNGVKWRRCFILAIIATFILFFLLYNRLPTGPELLISVIVLYVIYYLAAIFYQQTVATCAIKQIDQSIGQIKNKLRI